MKTPTRDRNNNYKETVRQMCFPVVKRKVWINSKFIKIGSVDTINQAFGASVFVMAWWWEPDMDNIVIPAGHREAPAHLWNPRLDIANVLVEEHREVWTQLLQQEDGRAWVVEKRKVKGVFTETMELEEFPFDVQDLSILVTSSLGEDEVELCEDLKQMSKVNTQNFVEESEWTLRKFVHCEIKIVEERYSQLNKRAHGLYFRCCIVRRSGFFLWNNILIMCIISALSITTFAVPTDNIAQRVELCFILLLSGVTFKFAASQAVPKISYLTHLDKYILASMVFIFTVCIWHAVYSTLNTFGVWLDRHVVVLVFSAVYLLLQLVFALVVVYQGHKRRWVINKREKDYLKRLAVADNTRRFSIRNSIF